MRKIIAAALAAVLTMCFASGCFFQTGEELYSLPQPPDEYLELQNVIESVLSSGAEYSAPTSGSNRQNVQLRDIDGDGQDEALAFFRSSEDSKPLKIYIFRMADEVYETQAVIEGDGTSIDSLNYIDLNGDGKLELIVGWKVSEDIPKALTVYRLTDGGVEEVTSKYYNQYTVGDMDGDGFSELIIMHLGDERQASTIEYVDVGAGSAVTEYKARLSMGITSISKVEFGKLQDGEQALYITSILGDGSLVTDVLMKNKNSLKNITLDAESGISTGQVRSYGVYTTDIDGDGVVEVPSPEQFPGRSQSPKGENVLKVTWNSIDSRERLSRKALTCHDFIDGWYLPLPDSWGSDVTVTRVGGNGRVTTVAICRYAGEDAEAVPLVKIYCLSREYGSAALSYGTLIATTGDMVYYYELTEEYYTWEHAYDGDIVADGFKTIENEWVSSNIW